MDQLYPQMCAIYGEEVAHEAYVEILEAKHPPREPQTAYRFLCRVLARARYTDAQLSITHQHTWYREVNGGMRPLPEPLHALWQRPSPNPEWLVIRAELWRMIPAWLRDLAIEREFTPQTVCCQHRMSRWYRRQTGATIALGCRDCQAQASHRRYWEQNAMAQERR
jgi:hypothetical protein